MNVKPADYATALVPPLATFTLGEINAMIGIAGGLIGIAYVLRKWHREEKAKKL